MTRLEFLFNRTLRRGVALMTLSVPQEVLLRDLAGKSVALIGNARALAETDHGAAIDGHDIVIRINRAPMPSPQSHGTRTDWLALATSLPEADRERIGAGRYLWMSHKRKRLDWVTASSPGFYLHPLADYRVLKADLGAQPTTGAMLIAMLARSDLSRLTLFGFDFFASLSLSGRRTAEKVPHDFGSEAAFVQVLISKDNRIIRA